MLYPSVVLCLTGMFILMFFWFLMPNFYQIFEQGGLIHADGTYSEFMAAPARALFTLSAFFRNPFILLLLFGGGGAAVAYSIVMLRRGWETYDEYMFRLPLFGSLIKMATLLKVTRTMKDLLVNGVSMVNALKLTSRVAGNNRIRRKLEEIRAAVEEGRSFSKSLGGDDVFPETMVWKIQMGEEKGIIEEALGEVATEFELDIETATTYLTSVISPMMLMGMAFVIMLLMGALYPSLMSLGKVH
jgi:type IV pilus assembly protein PilC